MVRVPITPSTCSISPAMRSAFYELLLDRFSYGTKADRQRALALSTHPHPPVQLCGRRDFDIARLAGGRTFDLIVRCAAFGALRQRSGCRCRPGRWRGRAAGDPHHRPANAFAGCGGLARHSTIRAIYRLFRFPGKSRTGAARRLHRSLRGTGVGDVSSCRREPSSPRCLTSARRSRCPSAGREDVVVLDGALTARRRPAGSAAERDPEVHREQSPFHPRSIADCRDARTVALPAVAVR